MVAVQPIAIPARRFTHIHSKMTRKPLQKYGHAGTPHRLSKKKLIQTIGYIGLHAYLTVEYFYEWVPWGHEYEHTVLYILFIKGASFRGMFSQQYILACTVNIFIKGASFRGMFLNS
jgi:hypothetical protein